MPPGVFGDRYGSEKSKIHLATGYFYTDIPENREKEITPVTIL
jgi:hypothetical protein